MATLFVYFRAQDGERSSVRELLGVMKDETFSRMGLPMQVMIRRESHRPAMTWMEIYADVPDTLVGGLPQWLDALSEEIGLTALIDGERHAEWFEPA